MTRYLLDINHLSPLVTVGHSLRQTVLERIAAGDNFAIPAPVLSEFLFGIGLLARAAENQAAWQELAGAFGYYHIDRQDAEAAAELRLRLRRAGRQLALIDALVAVVALRQGLTLLTTDGDFDAVPGLDRQSWW
ncbi:Ribonuclease VapC [Candidatus Promineifilum breve]|uniref:Ribonuclease VapC n=1 Tax=Candidatus Promineifilum breve TaxID=1806508 RepID=A0A160T360_9CHLR|nr:type II toxin-antitoxin system VapC family toxin [Candidatus Promineifilum breve]CUS04416.2 Ribonuclease VapC [Candidatus Promineifilum breve]